MWKKLLSWLIGQKGIIKKYNVKELIESNATKAFKPDLNSMSLKLFEDEFAFLSLVQGELKKGQLLVSQRRFSEARDVLKPLVTIVKASLIANYESERREKLLDIVEGTTILADTYIKEGDYSSAYKVLDDAQKYADDLTLLASNLKGTLTLVTQMYCMYLKCCHKLGKDGGKEIKEKIESVIAILSSCISRSPVSNKIQIVERICDYLDELIVMKAYGEACSIYLQVLPILQWEELDDYSLKHSYAILYGRYVMCLINSNTNDMNSCISSCLTEIEMYKNLLDERDCAQARMDLAVAYSHLANCYSSLGDYTNFIALHVKKIALLTDAIKKNIVDEDDIYDNEKMSDSIVISIKTCINKFGEVTGNNVCYYEKIFNTVKNINKYYLGNSELLAYINLIAGELFKYINNDDLNIAQDCLITRFTSLLYLLNNYGPERDVVKDFADTILYAQPFIIDNEMAISDELKELWVNSFSKAKEIFNL
jgi:tetratricopeptide (TPR) repeat protein